MPIQVEWYDETHTIQVLTFVGQWTADEFTEAVNIAVDMGSDVSHPLDILCDMRKSVGVPVNAISLVRWALVARPGKMRSLVVVTDSDFVRVLSRSLTSLYPRLWRKVTLVKTMEEAHKLISPGYNQTG